MRVFAGHFVAAMAGRVLAACVCVPPQADDAAHVGLGIPAGRAMIVVTGDLAAGAQRLF